MIQEVQNVLNVQIEKEGYSSNLYLSMASWAEKKGFKGVSSFLYRQADEERDHMLRIFHYINERGGKACVPEFAKPADDFGTIKEMFEQVFAHEKFISESILDLVSVCIEHKDYTTQQFLQWFVEEQVEEESSVQEILDKLELIGDGNMYMFDKDMESFNVVE